MMAARSEMGRHRISDERYYGLLTPLDQARILTPRLQRLLSVLVVAIPVVLLAGLWIFGRSDYIQSLSVHDSPLEPEPSNRYRGGKATFELVVDPVLDGLAVGYGVSWFALLMCIGCLLMALGAWRDVRSWRGRSLLVVTASCITLTSAVAWLHRFTLGENSVWGAHEPMGLVMWESMQTATVAMSVATALAAACSFAILVLALVQRRRCMAERERLTQTAGKSTESRDGSR
jgi:hypothetical protein